MKKLPLIVFGLSLQVATAQIPSTLGWYEATNTKIRPVCYGGANNTQCQNVVGAWNSGAMDTRRNQLLIFGGGHNDYGGNEVYAITLSGTPAVVRLTNNTNPSSCSQDYCGGVDQFGMGTKTPNSRHTYDGLEYMANVDKMAAVGGAPGGAGFPYIQNIWLFDPSTLLWQQMNPSGQMFNAQPGISTAYDPNSGLLLIDDLSNIYSYNATTNTLVKGGGRNPFISNYASVGVVDPVRKIFFVIGGGDFVAYDISGAPPFPQSVGWRGTTSGPTNCEIFGYPGVTYNPLSDRIECWTGGNTVYSLNVATRTWTAITNYTTGAPGVSDSQVVAGHWNYSPTLGVMALVNSIDQNLFTFRSSTGGTNPPPADTTPPSAPTNVSASAVSMSQINLAWSASTDNIGVTGYRIERCQGSSCTNFAQIATPNGTAYSDIGLSASTSYSYRVRATDAAGNLSPYSSTVSATTNASTPPPPATLQVGPGKPYATIGAAVTAATDGSIIEIDAGVYANETMTISKSLTLRGVGDGYAHLKWGTGDYLTNTSLIPNGKAILVISGSAVTLENLEFSGAKVSDQNGAGIRYEAGNLTVRHSYFHDNEDGFLGQAGATNTLLIEYSTFVHNGYCPSSCAHNLYIGNVGRLIFRYNKSIDSHEGHTLKSRALVNEIYNNYLSTKNSDGSYEAEFPNGGTVYFVGNVLEQGVNTGNSSIFGYGAEGATNPNPAIYAINNTFYNWRSNGATFIQISGGSPTLAIKNNIFAGVGTVLVGGSTDLSSNTTLTSPASSVFIDAHGDLFR